MKRGVFFLITTQRQRHWALKWPILLFVSQNYLSKRSEIGYPCAVSTSKNGQLCKVDMNGTFKGKTANFNMNSSKDNTVAKNTVTRNRCLAVVIHT